MANFLEDNDDLLYYLERGGIDWEPLVSLTEHAHASGHQKSAEGAIATIDEAVVRLCDESLDAKGIPA